MHMHGYKETITTQTKIRPNKFGSTHVDVVVIMTAMIIILSLDMPLIICSIIMHATSTVAGAHMGVKCPYLQEKKNSYIAGTHNKSYMQTYIIFSP